MNDRGAETVFQGDLYMKRVNVIQMLAAIVPDDADVVLLGDAEYDTVEMLDWVTSHTSWTFVVRRSPQLHITDGGYQYPLRQLL